MKSFRVTIILVCLVLVVVVFLVAEFKRENRLLEIRVHDLSQEVDTLKHGWVAPPQFRQAHKYHGILHSYWDAEKKDWYFLRNGKKCRLFGYGKEVKR